MSQDNFAALLDERVAKYLACLLGIGSQLCTLRLVWTFSSLSLRPHSIKSRYWPVSFVQPMIRFSMNLPNFVASSPTSHCSHVFGSGSTPIARQSAWHAVKSFSAPHHNDAWNRYQDALESEIHMCARVLLRCTSTDSDKIVSPRPAAKTHASKGGLVHWLTPLILLAL
jgi:hypothetical protein